MGEQWLQERNQRTHETLNKLRIFELNDFQNFLRVNTELFELDTVGPQISYFCSPF